MPRVKSGLPKIQVRFHLAPDPSYMRASIFYHDILNILFINLILLRLQFKFPMYTLHIHHQYSEYNCILRYLIFPMHQPSNNILKLCGNMKVDSKCKFCPSLFRVGFLHFRFFDFPCEESSLRKMHLKPEGALSMQILSSLGLPLHFHTKNIEFFSELF